MSLHENAFCLADEITIGEGTFQLIGTLSVCKRQRCQRREQGGQPFRRVIKREGLLAVEAEGAQTAIMNPDWQAEQAVDAKSRGFSGKGRPTLVGAGVLGRGCTAAVQQRSCRGHHPVAVEADPTGEAVRR